MAQNTEYFIPKNVKTRFEFFEGIGWKELGIIILGLGIGAGISAIIYLFVESMFCIIFAFMFAAFAYFLVAPDPRTGKNQLQVLRDMKDFSSRHKKYFYKFGDGRK